MAVVVGIVLAVLIAGGVAFIALKPKDSSDPDQAGPSQSTPRTTAPATTPAPAFTPYEGDVAALLIPLPAGATAAEMTFFHAGMTSKERFATLWNSNNPDWMEGVLTSNSYQDGADEEWTKGADFGAVALLQFEDPDGAKGWFDSASTFGFTGAASTGSVAGGKYAVLHLPDGRIETIAVFTKFEFGVHVDVSAGSEEENLSLITSLANDQLARITA